MRVTLFAIAFYLAGVCVACVCGNVAMAADETPAVVTSEANHGDRASGEFEFGKLAGPSKTDAANEATFTLVAGRRDRNGGDVDRLNDGRLPREADEPRSNFFFAAGSDGGMLLVDLGKEREIKGVNTYSWHDGSRGPQVYKLYAGDAKDKAFTAKPTRQTDLAKAGWKLLASVDTRTANNQTENKGEKSATEKPADATAGGQFAVNVAPRGGAAIGAYRYLLLDIQRTESADPFGNTFYSEIDVLDGQEHPAAKRSDRTPRETPAAELDVLKIGDKYEIAFDTSQMPEIKEWVDKKLKPVCTEWYPKIVELLPSDKYEAPKRFTIVFHPDMQGVANTGGTRINCAGAWFKRNLDGEAAGAVVHEMVHVVQQYGRTRGKRNPGWLVEGVADYIRWFLYEPEKNRPHPNPARAHYTDSYRTTAAFLNFVLTKHDKEIVKTLNAAMRQGKYDDAAWKTATGKTADELWDEYVKTLKTSTSRR
jgi:hypothetical protein